MPRLTTFLTLALLSLTTASAQIFSTGNTKIPTCGTACTLMNQAVQACSGATTSNQGTWICFCQSAYLKPLYSSAVGVCDQTCTTQADQQALVSWYTGECGTDFGANEHAGQAAVQTTTGSGAAATTTTSSAGTSQTGNTLTGSNSVSSATDGQPAYTGSWWGAHYKWIIMLVVIAIGLGLVAWLAVWLKRRHERRQDKPKGGFNEGITMRSTANTNNFQSTTMPVQSSGRDSPARTRDAFMPYGYGYSRSESRLGSRTNVNETAVIKGSPLAQGGTTMSDLEKDPESRSGKKRIHVRERSIDPEKQ